MEYGSGVGEKVGCIFLVGLCVGFLREGLAVGTIEGFLLLACGSKADVQMATDVIDGRDTRKRIQLSFRCDMQVVKSAVIDFYLPSIQIPRQIRRRTPVQPLLQCREGKVLSLSLAGSCWKN